MQKSLEKLDFTHSKLTIGFVYYVEHLDINGKRKSIEKIENIIPAVGVTYILGSSLNGVSPSSAWYASLWSDNSYTPQDSDTLAYLYANGVEEETYTVIGGQRPTIVPVLATGLWSNAASPIDFVFGGGAATVYGGFITNTQQRGQTTGVLLSAVKFAEAKVMGNGETLRVTCGLQLTALAD